jgi:hypothetical protein
MHQGCLQTLSVQAVTIEHTYFLRLWPPLQNALPHSTMLTSLQSSSVFAPPPSAMEPTSLLLNNHSIRKRGLSSCIGKKVYNDITCLTKRLNVDSQWSRHRSRCLVQIQLQSLQIRSSAVADIHILRIGNFLIIFVITIALQLPVRDFIVT